MKKLWKPKLVYINGEFKQNQAVLTEDGVILQVGDAAEMETSFDDVELIRWDDFAMVPGTVNVHNHCFQSLLRGLATDRPFLEWRDQALYKFSPILSPDDIYKGALFAFGEMMKYGVTTVSDFFYLHNDGKAGDLAIIRAAQDLGIRLVLARTMYDWNGAPSGYVESVKTAKSNTDELMSEYNGKNGRVSVVPAPHSLHAASLEMIEAGYDLAEKYGTKFHIHVAEEMFEVNDVIKQYGMRPMELFSKMGVLDDRMAAVHCVWLDEHEKELMCEAKASLCYCPSSNMFLADGVTDIPTLMKGGVTIGLGSDGACSNNRISVYEEMRMTSLLQKVHTLNALAVSGADAYQMGTELGGTLLDLPIGKIEPGFKADFNALDLSDISLQPLYTSYEQLIYNIVYSMQPGAIRRVVVDGNVTVSDGEIQTVSEKEIVCKVQEVMNKFQSV